MKGTAATKTPHITTAAQLCKKLRENFTGANKLDVIRELLAKRPHATAEEAYTALEQMPAVTQRTLDKARGLIDHGVCPAADNGYEASTPIEDTILAGLQRAADAAAARGAAERAEAEAAGRKATDPATDPAAAAAAAAAAEAEAEKKKQQTGGKKNG